MIDRSTYGLTPNKDVDAAMQLLAPTTFHSPVELRRAPPAAPKQPSIYAWYFDHGALRVPPEDCVQHDGRVLMYVGICPARRSSPDKPSKRTLRNRMRGHCVGPASNSTLRRTLGALLATPLSLARHPKGNVGKWDYGADGEARLSAWLDEHARVTWVVHPAPWIVEDALIAHGPHLPLNIRGGRGAMRDQLLSLRKGALRRLM